MALPPQEIGRRIRETREQVGLSVADLASALGVDPIAVERLEEGTLDPVPGDYVLIAARLLHTDFRYFISEELDDVERTTRRVFRNLTNPRPADLLAIRRFVSLCICENDLEQLLSMKRSSLPPTYPDTLSGRLLHKEQGRVAARQERERLRLGLDPITNVFKLLRDTGVHLFRHRLEDTDLSGVTVLHPRAGVCVLINYEDDLYRQFFSVAHEYGHVLFDRDQISRDGHVISYRYSTSALIEIRCNNFAAEFLLPTAAFDRYPRPTDVESVKEMVGRVALDYRINTETVAIRLKEMGWITDRTLRSFQQVRPVVVRRGEKVDPEIPADLTPSQVERRVLAVQRGLSAAYLDLLRRALSQDCITLGRFAEMLEMSVTEAKEFVASTGLAI
ncbi:MAG: helix-turn-helix domain-containing protein [Candidatus Binatia bacterium]